MAAIPTAGGASQAPRWVMRALLRVVVLVGLVAIGWLLGSGTSHADDDPGLPGTGLVPLAQAVSVHPVTSPAITRVLSGVPVPQLPVQSPLKLGVLRPIVQAVDLPKPRVLTPVSRPLHTGAPHTIQMRTPAPEQLVKVPPGPPPVAAAIPTAAVRTAGPTPASAHHRASPVTLCSPAQAMADPVIVQPAAGHGLPDGPAPVNPPGSDASACLIGTAGGGGGTKGDPDPATQAGSAMTDHIQPDGSAPQDSSGLPRSLSAQPSTSPD